MAECRRKGGEEEEGEREGREGGRKGEKLPVGGIIKSTRLIYFIWMCGCKEQTPSKSDLLNLNMFKMKRVVSGDLLYSF